MSAEHVTVLLENPDPVSRSRAHRSLAERALAREEIDVARSHYREAVELDPTDEVARAELDRLAPKSVGMFKVFFGW